MSIQTLTNYFLEYGAFFIFLIVLLEYLNLPGFPAGVIMPLSGIWASQGEISFPLVMVLTVAAGLTGSWALYWLGRAGGDKVLGFYFRKFPKQKEAVESKIDMLRDKGSVGVFVSKLLPMAYDHFDSGRDGKNGFCEIYHQFLSGDSDLESGVCRSRIFLWRSSHSCFGIEEGETS